MPSIVVLVKHVPDTWSVKNLEADHTLDRVNVDSVIDEVNEYAVEQALRIREANGEGWQVIAATMGADSADESLRKALSMGVDDAVRLTDDALAGSDAIATAWALTNLLDTVEDLQLIVTGRSSSDGDTGLLPGLLAEYRQIPALTGLNAVAVSGTTVTGTRVDARGEWSLEAQLPALVSVTDKADNPRYPNFKKIKAAKAHEITVHDLAAIGVDAAQVGLDASATRVQSAAKLPERTSGEIIQGGADPKAAAVQIADFLAARGLI
ncbi:electron transfer flavoprotein subunit beta/FixA family protein [Corynebacterium guangdongense]|uniref:Electron transfer flavoprotein subunit beta n=1 Tax=Corynebacterium guangdongense TaxID=1783348 RepID=A0ABU1ZW28_9CORY|nr:electron transfer flavoprotein subunit beta/FixA family protein [Corynebacterium guangdongense]MDR7329137.1 electron transfer flavoprotein beta subunit [Corynebacterium guangdongense]WJZ17706.1 Electron transfer flavoprotein subunit beta [Corynebacterium guangdongense]